MTDPITRLDEVRADHNVVAAFPDLDAARAAIVALEHAGVPPDTIALLGARLDPEGSDLAPIGTKVATGAGAGAAAASAIGALSSLVIPGIGLVAAAGIWAAACAATGGVIGGVSKMGESEAWRHTFEAVESGNVAVGVHADDEATVDLACETLEAGEPLALNRFTG